MPPEKSQECKNHKIHVVLFFFYLDDFHMFKALLNNKCLYTYMLVGQGRVGKRTKKKTVMETRKRDDLGKW